jgi:hypothetical protein
MPTTPATWDVYKVAKKAIWLGTVEAPDKQAAVEKTAQEFKNGGMAPVCGGAPMIHRKGEITKADLRRRWPPPPSCYRPTSCAGS